MERVKSRSESPFSRSKGKVHSSNGSENGSRITEQLKNKKKNLRSKNKNQLNGKDVDDLSTNGQDVEEEQGTSNEVDNQVDSSNAECETEVNGVNKIENGNTHEEIIESNENGHEKDASNVVCEVSKEVVLPQDDSVPVEGVVEEESESTEEEIIVDENSLDGVSNQSKPETESNANKDTPLPDCKVVIDALDDKSNQDTNNTVKSETNGMTQEEESIEECSQVEENSQNGLNGSDESINNEKEDVTQNQIQASPDTVTKEENSFQNKITSFFGKLACSPAAEPKQESEITSSKKMGNTNTYHPYLSQVSGRRGIKERLNSSATVFTSTEHVAKTPESGGASLDDSFRVRTNPPRLNSADLNENPTLRKFKGKRCLNDEPEEGEDALSTIKRRKLDEKTQESGILGSILWSPFKKRALESENQLKINTTESKLSRLLSPFWFWKKATEGQNRK